MASKQIAISKIDDTKFANPRSDLGDIAGLAADIEAKGQLQAVGVIGDDRRGYALIFGFRRFAAMKSLGKTTIDAAVVKCLVADIPLVQLAENLQRENLTPIDEAMAFQSLLTAEGASIDQATLATAVGRSKGHVSQVLKLLTLHPDVQKALCKGSITFTDCRVLGKLSDPEDQAVALSKVETFMSAAEAAYDRQAAIAASRAEREAAKAAADGKKPKAPKKPTAAETKATKSKLVKDATNAQADEADAKGKPSAEPQGKGKGKDSTRTGAKPGRKPKGAAPSIDDLAAKVVTKVLDGFQGDTEQGRKLSKDEATVVGAVVTWAVRNAVINPLR